jgi:hypothetical protein
MLQHIGVGQGDILDKTKKEQEIKNKMYQWHCIKYNLLVSKRKTQKLKRKLANCRIRENICYACT